MINVAQPMWELPILPPRWRRALTGFDALLCGSRYLEAVYQLQVPGALTLPSPCPISLPERIQRRRADYGLPEGITLFMTAFDPASDLARKNPLGSVDAYLLAFPKEEGKTMLLLKANGLDKRPEGAMLANHIRDRVGSRQDIRLLDASMSYEDTLGLYACADAFVSLHRSEGLGLPLLEAMMLGLPVIATAWSGNMSFMSPGSACLVDYDFIRVQAYLDVYQQAYLGAPAYWADPSLESACAWMRRLDESPELRLQIGQSAKKQARQYVEQALKADYLEQIQALADSHWTTGRARPQIAPHDLWQAARQREPGPLQTALDALSREFSRYVWRWQQ
jgi:glycosyltransferase involved in cell wall biosynthesis